jgi:hypothetical protein
MEKSSNHRYNIIYSCSLSAITYPVDDPGTYLVTVEDKSTGTSNTLHPLKIHNSFCNLLGTNVFVIKSGVSQLIFQLSLT